jgi:hypothetical protein
VDIIAARYVVELVSDHLDLTADWSAWTLIDMRTELPAWPDTPDARRRGRRRMAVGMLVFTLEAPAPDEPPTSEERQGQAPVEPAGLPGSAGPSTSATGRR